MEQEGVVVLEHREGVQEDLARRLRAVVSAAVVVNVAYRDPQFAAKDTKFPGLASALEYARGDVAKNVYRPIVVYSHNSLDGALTKDLMYSWLLEFKSRVSFFRAETSDWTSDIVKHVRSEAIALNFERSFKTETKTDHPVEG